MPGAIFSGDFIKNLKSQLNINDDAYILTGSTDPRVAATDAPAGSLYLNTATAEILRKLDAGSTTNWEELGASGASGINYVTNPDFEAGNANGWATYDDGAVSEPVDGTGGSPLITLTTTSSNPLRGTYSGLITKDGSNRQGQGVSTDVTIDRQDLNSAIYVSFDYETSANYVADDIIPFIYDKDGTVLTTLTKSGTSKRFTGVFYSGDNDDYRLILHIASTNASSYTFKFDNVKLGPDALIDNNTIEPISETQATLTGVSYGSYVGNVVNFQFEGQRVGDTYTLGVIFNFDVLVNGNGFDALTIPLSNFDFLTGKTVSEITGSFNTNVNSISDDVLPGFASLSGGALALNFTGYLNTGSTNRFAHGTITFKTDAEQTAMLSTTETLNSPVKALAVISSGFSVPNATTTIIDYDNVVIDNTNSITTGASWRFTAPKTGNYYVSTKCFYSTASWTSGGTIELQVYINGALSRVLDYLNEAVTSGFRSLNGAVLLSLSKGDYIDARTLHAEGTARSISGDFRHTYISIEEMPDFSTFSVFGNTELLESSAASAAYTITANQWGDLTSLTLSEGEWDLWAQVTNNNNGAITTGNLFAGIGTTAGNVSPGTEGDVVVGVKNFVGSGNRLGIYTSKLGVTVTSDTVYYLKANYSAAIANLFVGYHFWARRVK